MPADQVIEGGGLRLLFYWQGDRWAHAVERIGGPPGAARLVESIERESVDREAALPSPPLQDLHRETRPGDRQVALLVGRAGRNHWSAACTLDGAVGRIEFDIACRAQEPPGEMASSYRLLVPAVAAGPARVELADGAGSFECESPTRLERTASRLVCRAAEARGPLPATFRWQYAVRCGPG